MHLTSKLKGTLFAATLVAASAFSTGIVPNTFCISEAQAQEDLLLNPDKLATKGNLDAIVTIIEFSDFQCPFSSRVNPTLEQVLHKVS